LMAIVRQKEVTGLKDHARLIIHACVHDKRERRMVCTE
jgi:hypothetical protein